MISTIRLKNQPLVLAFLSISILSGTFGCAETQENKIKTDRETSQPEQPLAEPDEYGVDMEKFKALTKRQIVAHNKRITELRGKMDGMKGDAKISFEKKIRELDRKNSEMEIKLDDYQMETSEHWYTFKAEFNYDMNALGKALNDLTQNNIKH